MVFSDLIYFVCLYFLLFIALLLNQNVLTYLLPIILAIYMIYFGTAYINASPSIFSYKPYRLFSIVLVFICGMIQFIIELISTTNSQYTVQMVNLFSIVLLLFISSKEHSVATIIQILYAILLLSLFITIVYFICRIVYLWSIHPIKSITDIIMYLFELMVLLIFGGGISKWIFMYGMELYRMKLLFSVLQLLIGIVMVCCTCWNIYVVVKQMPVRYRHKL